MKLVVNPVEKIGTLNIRPNWRYDALQNPAKYKMQGYVSVPRNNSSCLKRFLSAGLSYEVNYKVPNVITQLANSLTSRNKDIFLNYWERYFKREREVKISIDTNRELFTVTPIWNLKHVHNINDAFLVKVIRHHSGIEYNQHIAKAMEISQSPEHSEIFRFIGYCIYAKISDNEIAKRWCIPVKQVEAIRLIHFDFSRFPKDRMANFSYLRQLTNIGLFSDVDFAYYKRVFELGELGLKAQTDFFSLDKDEKHKIEQYLGKSVVANTLNINFSIKNQKDAMNYGMVVSNLASYYIKEAEMTYFGAKTKNLEACTKRIEGSMTDIALGMTDLDKEFIALLGQHSLQDDRLHEYKTLESLK